MDIDFTIGEHRYQIISGSNPGLIVNEAGYDYEKEIPELYALVREVARLRAELEERDARDMRR